MREKEEEEEEEEQEEEQEEGFESAQTQILGSKQGVLLGSLCIRGFCAVVTTVFA